MNSISNPDARVHDALCSTANRVSEQIAVCDDAGTRLSYGEVRRMSRAVADRLVRNGVREGDRVLVCCENQAVIVPVIYGVLEAGAIFVPIDESVSGEAFAHILADCEPGAVIAEEDCRLPIPKDLTLFHFWEFFGEPLPGDEITDPSVSPGSLAMIVYTSGTTALPLGVACSHAQICFACGRIGDVLGIGPEDRILGGLPLAFDYGLYQVFLSVAFGGRLVLTDFSRNAIAAADLIREHHITILPAMPPLLTFLLEMKLFDEVADGTLRMVTSTGEMFPLSQIQQLQSALPRTAIVPMYGLTECKRVSIVPPQRAKEKAASVGLPLPGTRVEIVDRNCRVLPVGEIGELVVYGPHLAQGYWRNPEVTKEKFRIDAETHERRLHTGDQFHQDEDGYLYFHGRDGSFVKVNGRRISAIGLEAGITELGGVAEAAVVGIPDPTLGEQLVVFVRPSSRASISEGIVRRHLASVVPASINRPQILFCKSRLPTTGNGKIDRKKLQKEAGAALGTQRKKSRA